MLAKKLFLMLITVFLISALILGSCSSSTSETPTETTTPTQTTAPTTAPPAPKTLVIGDIVNLSGFLAPHHVPQEAYTQAYVELVNERGGITIKGQQYLIELITEDSKSTPEAAMSAANKLVFEDEVDYILGPLIFQAAAASPIFNENEVMHINGYTTFAPAEIGPDTPYNFVTTLGMVGSAIPSMQLLKRDYPDVKTILMVLPDDGAEPYVMPAIEDAAADLGYDILDTILVGMGVEDFVPVAARIDAYGADAVIYPGGPLPQLVAVGKELRALGNTAPYVSAIYGPATHYQDAAGDDVSDLICIGFTKGAADNPPLLNELIERVPPEYDITINWAFALDVLLRIMEKADSIDKADVMAEWEKTTELKDTLYGDVIFCGTENFGQPNHCVATGQSFQVLNNGVITDLGWMPAKAID